MFKRRQAQKNKKHIKRKNKQIKIIKMRQSQIESYRTSNDRQSNNFNQNVDPCQFMKQQQDFVQDQDVLNFKYKHYNIQIHHQDGYMKSKIFPAYNQTFLVLLQDDMDLQNTQNIKLKHIDSKGNIIKKCSFKSGFVKMISNYQILLYQIKSSNRRSQQNQSQKKYSYLHLIKWNFKQDIISQFFDDKFHKSNKKLQCFYFSQTRLLCFVQITMKSSLAKGYIHTYYYCPPGQDIQFFAESVLPFQLPQKTVSLSKNQFFPIQLVGKINQKQSFLYIEKDVNSIQTHTIIQKQQKLIISEDLKTKFIIYNGKCQTYTPTCFCNKDEIYQILRPMIVQQFKSGSLLLYYRNHNVQVRKQYHKDGVFKIVNYTKYISSRYFVWNYLENTYKVINPQCKTKIENIQFSNKIKRYIPKYGKNKISNFYPLVVADPQTGQIVGYNKKLTNDQKQIHFYKYDPTIYVEIFDKQCQQNYIGFKLAVAKFTNKKINQK